MQRPKQKHPSINIFLDWRGLLMETATVRERTYGAKYPLISRITCVRSAYPPASRPGPVGHTVRYCSTPPGTIFRLSE